MLHLLRSKTRPRRIHVEILAIIRAAEEEVRLANPEIAIYWLSFQLSVATKLCLNHVLDSSVVLAVLRSKVVAEEGLALLDGAWLEGETSVPRPPDPLNSVK